MNLFFHPHLNHDAFELDAEESRHVKAMRHSDGDSIQITDGQGTCITGQIEWKKHIARIQVAERLHHAENKERLRLVMAPTKQHERMEWLLEKAVEMGIASIHFVQCANSERPIVRMDRLQRVAIAAIKQSQRYHLPLIQNVARFETLLHELAGGKHLFAHCREEYARQPIAQHCDDQSATIWIGPEGDFTAKEIEDATKRGAIAISLGSARLRTETAALAAIAAVQMHCARS